MMNCALTLLATLGMVHAGVSKNGACLLQRPQQTQLAKTSMSLVEVEVDMEGMASSMVHKAWRQRHAKLWRAMNKTDGIGKFIAAQSASSDACSARLMEAKRALDGLKSDVKQLSAQVDGHESVLETETSNLNISKLSIKSVKDNTEMEKKKCEELKKEAENEAKQFSAELEELKQIANPKETFNASPEAKTGLLQEMEWSRERCLAFVKFTKKHGYVRQHDPETRDCDTQREELQKAFTKAWKEIADLLKDAQERVNDTSCFDDADAAEVADLVPLLAAREQASGRIENANEAIASLDPVLSTTKQRSEKLMDHIDEVLTPECFEAADVSKVLMHIRELIMVLEECPGRQNFKLKIPEVSKDGDNATADDAVDKAVSADDIVPGNDDIVPGNNDDNAADNTANNEAAAAADDTVPGNNDDNAADNTANNEAAVAAPDIIPGNDDNAAANAAEVEEEVKEPAQPSKPHKTVAEEFKAAKAKLEQAKKHIWDKGSASAKQDVEGAGEMIHAAAKDLQGKHPDVLAKLKIVEADVDKVLAKIASTAKYLGKDWQYDAEDVLVDAINQLDICIKKLV